MAHKKAQGSTQNLRDSKPKYLGVKKFGGEVVAAGNIIVRQRGSKYRAGSGVKVGKDDTLFAVKPGKIKFNKKLVKKFTGRLEKVTIVNVE